ncbi:hypothetical protein HYN56_06130 [Flavobacterium crocinum]|uniref:DUF5683 domain-containing protein n=1 Tax=Flavobacterium crocinum TaxID=2183896 RepID=A0A2S1YIC6_9FLAO|nr:DUF5683 domain-containing protein [Flavobacterium crocinum]AWK03825.1 hypothetical protein HYN56_06130 [Flavobacterium crocinum]
MQNQLIILFLFLGLTTIFAQEKGKIVLNDSLKSETIDPLRPSKAAFYSAILPGLGQVYNKKYWKVPLVYGAIGTSTYLYIDNQKKYHLYRDEYKNRLEGLPSKNPSLAELDENRLLRIQKGYQRNRDLSSLFMVGFYILNIIDANIDAALSQFNVDENLAFKPAVIKNDITLKNDFGLALNYSF